ncbi:S41 family peptidase [Sphingomonas sp. CJ20]
MKPSRLLGLVSAVSLLASCGGGGGGGGSVSVPGGTGTVTPTPTPTSAANGCTLRERQDWAAAQLREWYLFPETLPTGLNPAAYTSVDDYIDALTANARAQNKDRYFTYLTSIAEENAYYASGSSAGFGFRLGYDSVNRRIFIAESFEGGPALTAGIDRGAEIVAIGTSAGSLRTVSAILATEGPDGVNNALGPSTVGTTRVLRIADASGTRDLTVAKADYALPPVSSRYGARILDDGGTKIGYLNLRTFIETADPALRTAFAQFRAAGVTKLIVDLRYNGGGLISIAELMGDLMGANRAASDVFDYVTFRPEKSAENSVRYFRPQAESVAPTRIAFIGTGGTASASEMVINAFVPYLHTNAGLIGTNTYGKPVGQIALDRTQCDDRLRVIALAVQNSARQGNYYNGLASTMEASCRAVDDIAHPLGDPAEASTRAAMDYLAGRSCTPISASLATASAERVALGTPETRLLTPARPSPVQREVPGAY